MAKITPIDIIKGVSQVSLAAVSRKNKYFATNKYSYRIHLAKRINPFT